MGLPLLKRPTRYRPGRLSGRQAVGILLAFLLLMGGRLVRHRMLITPDGRWRDPMWLDEIVLASGEAEAAQRAPKPELTNPLPINSCSADSLTLLPGVGPVLAERIRATRAEGLIFRNAEDLRSVKGIGPKLSAKLAPLIDFTVETPTDSVSEDSQ